MKTRHTTWYTVQGVIDGRASVFEAQTLVREDARSIHTDLIRREDCVEARIILHHGEYEESVLISARQRDNGNRWMHEGNEAVFPFKKQEPKEDPEVFFLDPVDEGDTQPDPQYPDGTVLEVIKIKRR